MRFCIIGALIFSLVTGVLGEVVSGPIVNPSNGHSYYLLTRGQSWTASQAEAELLGGHLVTINDAAENAWVADTFGQFNNLYWIGLNDVAMPDTFVWSSGDLSDYRNWYPGQPENASAGSNYVALLTDQTRQWIAFPNTLGGAWGIAEVVPEPSGLAMAFSAMALAALRRRRSR